MTAGVPNDSQRQTTVIIIGAGPSGLVLGKELTARGIDFVILEKGSIGDSWAQMAKQLKLVSPWKCNWLSRDEARRHAPNEQVSRAQFLDYLRDYALVNELPIRCGCEVFSVRRDGDG